MNNVVNLQIYYSHEELEREIAQFMDFYNNRLYHDSLDNLTQMEVLSWRSKGCSDKTSRDYETDVTRKTPAEFAGAGSGCIITSGRESVS